MTSSAVSSSSGRQQPGQPAGEHRLADAGRSDDAAGCGRRPRRARAHAAPAAARARRRDRARRLIAARAGVATGSSSSPLSHATTSVRCRAPCAGMPATSAASAAQARGHTSALRPTRRAVSAAISAPCTGRSRPSNASSPRTRTRAHARAAAARWRRGSRPRSRDRVASPASEHAGREVDDHAPRGQPQLARHDAGAHALARLADRAIRQADDDRRPVAPLVDARLDLDEPLDADRRLTVGDRDHGVRLEPLCYVGVTGGTRLGGSARGARRWSRGRAWCAAPIRSRGCRQATGPSARARRRARAPRHRQHRPPAAP